MSSLARVGKKSDVRTACKTYTDFVHQHFRSRLRPNWYTYVFIACDVSSLVMQSVGGALAATADPGGKIGDVGTNLMIAGIIWQVVGASFSSSSRMLANIPNSTRHLRYPRGRIQCPHLASPQPSLRLRSRTLGQPPLPLLLRCYRSGLYHHLDQMRVPYSRTSRRMGRGAHAH